MTVVTLQKIGILGIPDSFPIVEDALTALKCMEVTAITRGDHHFLIEGWLPVAWRGDLEDILERGTGGAVAVVEGDTDERALAHAPVLLDNPRFAAPFQHLVELFSLPGRPGYDPTLLTLLLVPLFIGFVIGDAGRGLVLLAAGLLIRRRIRTPVGDLASAFLITGGAAAVLFGALVFGEVFSHPLEPWRLPYARVNRTHDPRMLLIASLLIGLTHLTLGIAIGVVDETRRAGLKAAVLRKISWLLLETGLILLVLGTAGLMARAAWVPGLALTALAILLIGLGGGITDILQVPAFLTHILSYLRLGALAVAEALLGAFITGTTRDLAAGGSPAHWLGAAAVFIAGHGLALALEILVVSLYALRLHYVEFYPEFYRLEEIGRVPRFHPRAKPAPP